MSAPSGLRALAHGTPFLERAYRRAVSLWPYAARLGPDFWRFYAHLEAAQHRPAAELEEEQFAAVRRTVEFAYAHSPFYRRLWDEHGVAPADVRSPEEFSARIPLVDRDALFGARDLAVPMRGSTTGTTSGTTGTAFQFAIDRASTAMERAAIFHQWTRAGFRPGDMRVEMRAYQVQPVVEYPDLRVVRVTVVDMRPHLREIVGMMNRRRIPFIHGYPSAVAKFAALLREQGLRLDFAPRGVFLASEAVYDWQVDAIREVLAPETLIAHYGTAERVVLGAWCEHARAYHFLNPYGKLELGPRGEIIGTSLINRATPFVRYRLNDVALDVEHTPCPHCGRGYTPRVTRIGGRLEDYLLTHAGELIPPAMVTYLFKNLRHIQRTQIVQAADGGIVLRCVVAGEAPAQGVEGERRGLRDGLRKVLGASVPVEFEEVDELPLTRAGKLKWIVSEAAGAAMPGGE